ncbi:glycosyltransferase family 4 protein [bacterium]|nr:glycosyltransferase family 4 protein [bacterium]
MLVMLISPYLPHRRVGHGGGVAIRDMVRHLGRRHEITLVSLERSGDRGLAAEVGAELGVDVRTIPFLDAGARGLPRLGLFAGRAAALCRGLAQGHPYYVSKYWSRRISAAILEAAAATDPDVIHVQCMQLTLYLRDLRRLRDAGGLTSRLVLGSDEVSSLPWGRRMSATRNPLLRSILRHQYRAWRHLQTAATDWADITFCVTDQDRDLLLADGGRTCHTVPLGVDIESIAPAWEPTEPPRLLFVGSFAHRPNRTAAGFLVDKVWPIISKYRQDMELVLVGRGARRFLAASGGGDRSITALGYVEDLTDLYRRCRLFVAPLTEGGGIKIKILEAMAHGIPVATTPTGAEGITDDEEGAIWIGEADDAFADMILRMLVDHDEATKRAHKARTVIEERFGWPAIVRRMTDLYSSPERG